ncbi:hypothetical protein SG34_025115 [Thalassomonas viridans]|uniref:3-oxoacyl-ACP synthase n=1 Tax=Thalassomonas viridans TaxID=137584 RepID=A0AAF0C8V2_9GAMM|nr:hypothetical protein [Thalassomonas viridans]WDE04575.1 hypothetical protein SG34_025115 [Thalassomonas viridans]
MILDIQPGFPSSTVTNQDVLELVKANSYCSKKDFIEINRQLNLFFNECGSGIRLWRRKATDPFEILIQTGHKILNKINKRDIDVVIFCSVSKYVAEPAHTSLIAKQLGLTPKISFDISDGCMGWLTSLSILENMSSNQEYKHALIISHEFPMHDNGAVYPKSFSFRSIKEVAYKAPALTLGEACCYTLVDMQKIPAFSHRLEFPRGAELCTMPFRNYAEFCGDIEIINDIEEFHSYYSNMSIIGAKPSLNMLNEYFKGKDINLAVHSYTKSFEKLKSFLKFKANILNYFDEYGNLATASIPINIWLANERGQLDNKELYAWCASAGLKSSIMKIDLDKNFKKSFYPNLAQTLV